MVGNFQLDKILKLYNVKIQVSQFQFKRNFFEQRHFTTQVKCEIDCEEGIQKIKIIELKKI